MFSIIIDFQKKNMYTAIARIAKKLKGEMLYETDLPTKKETTQQSTWL